MSTPTKLSDITIEQWVEFYYRHGKEHARRFAEVIAMPEGEERQEQYLLYDVDVALETYSFYSGTPVAELDIKEVYITQNTAFAMLKAEEDELSYVGEFMWNGEKWAVQPLYKVSDKLTHEHFEIAQDLALIFSDFQDGKIEAIYHLCAAYFRKVDEPYASEFTALDSERAELMKKLPVNYAMAVKKYVTDSINTYNSLRR